jgi:hypothetical protein
MIFEKLGWAGENGVKAGMFEPEMKRAKSQK